MQASNSSYSRLLVLGGAGRVGQPLLQQALAAGYAVTAIVRDPTRLELPERADLRVVQGDVSDLALLDAAIAEGVDAVVSTLGIFNRQPGTPVTDLTRPLIELMHKHGVRRLVSMSSLGVGESRRWGGLIEQFVIRVILRHVLRDKQAQEQLIAESGLDWTILRPPRILESLERKPYERWLHHSGRRRWKVSRADAAAEMLHLLEDRSSFQQTWHISY